MPIHFSRWLLFMSLLLIMSLSGCVSVNGVSTTRLIAHSANNTSNATSTAIASNNSTARFTLTENQVTTTYTLHTTVPTSELRHGHREFTITLANTDLSLFIVFYGYQGPGNYTLSDSVNGGDIHIGRDNESISWDLLMQPQAHCSLTVISDIPTQSAGLDRMQGTFACPQLLSSSPDKPQKPITVSNGSFDIAILVAS